MLSEKLKTNTKSNHQELEKKLVAQMRAMRNAENYTQLLSLFYSFFGGLELLINKQLDAAFLPDYLQRRKTAALADDLMKLGATLPELATGDALPAITNQFEALGALYVIEGSTLGGKIISKMVKQQLQFPDDTGLSFFNGYGEQTDAMWNRFKQAINQEALVPHEDVIVETANETFAKFRGWFDSRPQ